MRRRVVTQSAKWSPCTLLLRWRCGPQRLSSRGSRGSVTDLHFSDKNTAACPGTSRGARTGDRHSFYRYKGECYCHFSETAVQEKWLEICEVQTW